MTINIGISKNIRQKAGFFWCFFQFHVYKEQKYYEKKLLVNVLCSHQRGFGKGFIEIILFGPHLPSARPSILLLIKLVSARQNLQ